MQKVKLHPFHMSKRHPIITFDKYTLLINTKQARLIPQKTIWISTSNFSPIQRGRVGSSEHTLLESLNVFCKTHTLLIT